MPALAISGQRAGDLAGQVVKAAVWQLRVLGGCSKELRHLPAIQLPDLAGVGEAVATGLGVVQQLCRRGAHYLQCAAALSGSVRMAAAGAQAQAQQQGCTGQRLRQRSCWT